MTPPKKGSSSTKKQAPRRSGQKSSNARKKAPKKREAEMVEVPLSPAQARIIREAHARYVSTGQQHAIAKKALNDHLVLATDTKDYDLSVDDDGEVVLKRAKEGG